MADTTSKPYSVLLWGSHPDAENDDCWTGDDYATRAEAEAAFADPWGVGGFDEIYHSSDTAYFEIDGPDTNRVRKNPDFKPDRDAGAEWRNEFRMQAAMGHDIQGWNDFEGC